MKRLSLILTLIIFIFILTSCNINNVETVEKISAPNNTTPPISGVWKVEKYKTSNRTSLSENDIEKILGKKIFFYKNLVVVEDGFSLESSYKVKKVNTSDYLFYHYKISPDFLNINNENIQIISLSAKEQFYYEIIKANNNEIIFNTDGVFFYLSKLSNEVDYETIEKYIKEEKKDAGIIEGESNDTLRTGLLLGLRYYDEESVKKDEQPWKYRTIWIRSYNKNIKDIYEKEDILLPRKTGFWEVEAKENIYAYPYSKKNKDKSIKLNKKENSNGKRIEYLGNDYISIENIENNGKGGKELRTYLLDNIDEKKPIKISDIGGRSLRTAFLEGAGKQRGILASKDNNLLNERPDEESFGLTRKNGHWILKGRISYEEKEVRKYTDFNIKAVPPIELVTYDELLIPWNGIKMKVPEVVDAYTSPNEDIVIILTNKYILIYPIHKGELGDKPFGKIPIKEKEKIIMAEWATGGYVKTWEDIFLKNDPEKTEIWH